jgi:signal transduction histidine kinase
MSALVIVSIVLAVGCAAAVAAGARRRQGGKVRYWAAGGAAVSSGLIVVVLTLRGLAGTPADLAVWLVGALLAVPVAVLAGSAGGTLGEPHVARRVLVESLGLAGGVVLGAVVYLVVVVGIEGPPRGHERSVLLASLVAAIVAAALAAPVRHRVRARAAERVGGAMESTGHALGTFGARMSRAVPMDELMLQLAETLRDSVAPVGAEIWTGSEGVLSRTVSVPSRPAAALRLGEQERVVVARARLGGPAWAAVWLPEVAAEHQGDGDWRAVPVAHLGELLGLIVVARAADGTAFTTADDDALVELARQLGLALHNVRLDSALQASLAELAERNEQLQASRRRIVTAADSSRRAIERNLHDGAQQHLVALAVKLGLARQIAQDGSGETVTALLEELRADVQTTITELRELAHGIYPPLLRDRGLAEALRTAAARSPLPCAIEVDVPGRYPEEVETAAYFCCLEGLQNAGKYAGDAASVTVRVSGTTEALSFEITDDGLGFDQEVTPLGAGVLNMTDRIGALGGELAVTSAPGLGTTVRARVPAQPLSPTGQVETADSASRSSAGVRSSLRA